MMPETEKSGGNGNGGILIIGGLIVGGIIIAMILKSKPQSTQFTQSPDTSPVIQQMQEHITQLEQHIMDQQIKTTSALTPLELNGQDSGWVATAVVASTSSAPGQSTVLQSSVPSVPQNLIRYTDGSVTDVDVAGVGEKYKNKESWSIKRDADGAITGIEVERNASVGNNASQ
jgi:hypothetical protein